MRICPICRASLDDLGKRRKTIYCSGTCRAEASRRRLGRPGAARFAHTSARRGQGGANRRVRRTPDLRPSYDKALTFVTARFVGPPYFAVEATARQLVAQGLRDALTERQRAALDQRGTKT